MSGRPEGRAVLGLPASLVTLMGNTSVVLVLLTAGYYVVPFRVETADRLSLTRLVVSGLLLLVIAWVFRRHARRSRRVESPEMYQIQWLLSSLYLLVLVFAMVYAVTSRIAPEQFNGITDRTDALYYSVTVVSTVGFGDVTAEGNLGRLMVSAQMIFDLIFIGTAFRLLSNMRTGGPMSP